MSGVIQENPIPELRRVLRGSYRLDLARGAVRVRIGPLPGRLIAAGAVEAGHTWLFIDREKPGAMAHARELLATHPELLATHPGLITDAAARWPRFVLSRTSLRNEPGDFTEIVLPRSG